MSGSNPELIVASVALVISFVALTATFMQVLQQYYASASGYSQCSSEVMGAWAESKSRRFSWEELRFVVEFDTPVIFLSPPDNKKGPISDQEIVFLDGSHKSRVQTHTCEETATATSSQPRDRLSRSKERIQTADHERASWLVLLNAVQRMETSSSEWQKDLYTGGGPPRKAAEKLGLPPAPPTLEECHTLTVAVQRKRRSWDTMPASVSRPYATTTMCHLVEMMAALGVYWKEFDRGRDRYRAEGNGFTALGERVSNMGLMFSFQVYGQAVFERNRVIPVDDVKELCFGLVPTIYRHSEDHPPRRLTASSHEFQDVGSLRMATRAEIAETLVSIGCNKNSVQHFSRDKGQTTHLFPVSFEIVGMLARTFHMDNSYFTYLPNPTPDVWDERSLSVVKMMESYQQLSRHGSVQATQNAAISDCVASHVDSILKQHQDLRDYDGVGQLLYLKALHAALDDADEILTAKPNDRLRGTCKEAEAQGRQGSPDARGAEAADVRGRRREVVRDVLRSHIQEVLRLLNEREPEPQAHGAPRADPAPHEPSFQDINKASPDDRQHKFMEVYFGVIRPQVVRQAKESADRRADAAHTGHGLGSAGAHGGAPGHDRGARRARKPNGAVDEADEEDADAESSLRAARGETASHEDIWRVLVFRMICWLMLHNFSKDDVQVSKSELLGSRMPVYIA